MATQRLLLLAATVLVVGGGGAATAANRVPPIGSDCGTSVAGRGFRVFACESGGVRAGRPHPKELLVVRSDGSSVGYPAFGGEELAAGDGEVVGVHDMNLVRVTRNRLVTLLTSARLARALHGTLVMGISKLSVDARGDVYFVVSVLTRGHAGCRNPLLERTAAGTLRQIRASTSRNGICS